MNSICLPTLRRVLGERKSFVPRKDVKVLLKLGTRLCEGIETGRSACKFPVESPLYLVESPGESNKI
jgi:hypothetical protein